MTNNITSKNLIYGLSIDEYIKCIDLINPHVNINFLNSEMKEFVLSMLALPIADQQKCWPVVLAFQNKFQQIDDINRNIIFRILGNIDEYIEMINLLDAEKDIELLNEEMALFAKNMRNLSIGDQQMCWSAIEEFNKKFDEVDQKDPKRKALHM